MIGRILPVILSGILFALPAQAIQVPRTLEEILVYPGAVRDNMAEAELTAEEQGYLMEDDGASISCHVYKVSASVETVLRFYLAKLGGTDADASEHLYNGSTAAGTVSPVFHQIHFVDFSVYREADARQIKAELNKIREPFKPGKWVSGAQFSWEVGEPNADISNYELELQDEYFYAADERGRNKVQTRIIVRKTTHPNEAHQARQHPRWDQEGEGDVGHIPDAAFSPEDIGIPLYSGARFDAETTQFLKESMSVNGMAYQSDDPVTAVARFYEQQPGFKRTHADENGVLLKRCEEEYNEFLKRMMSGDCNAEITIQNPWMDMKTGRLMKTTLISIVSRAE